MLTEMKTLHAIALVVLAFFLSGPVCSYAAGSKEGNIRVVKVKGSPTVTNAKDKSTTELKEGVFIQQGSSIKTGKDSEAMLLFSNGTTVTVQQNSNFSVEQFLQTPFDSDKVDYKDLKGEPSVSKTKVSVSEGSILADVAKLAKGSTFNIGTPIGVAGIRGTLIQLTVNTTAGGQISVTVNLPEGLADFAATNGQQITLNNGQTITVTSDPVTGTITLGNVRPLDAQTIQQLQALAEQVAAAIPAEHDFEGVPDGAPEIENQDGTDNVGGFGGDMGTGNVGTATGGSGGGGSGGGGGSTPTPTPTPAPPTPTPVS